MTTINILLLIHYTRIHTFLYETPQSLICTFPSIMFTYIFALILHCVYYFSKCNRVLSYCISSSINQSINFNVLFKVQSHHQNGLRALQMDSVCIYIFYLSLIYSISYRWPLTALSNECLQFTRSHTDGDVHHAMQQPVCLEQLGLGFLLRDTSTLSW